MIKALLVSILIATIAIPTVTARERSAHRGLKKALFYTFVFEIFYLIFLIKIYPSTF